MIFLGGAKQHCTRHTSVMRGRGGLAPVRIEREQNNFDIRQHVVYMFIRYIIIKVGKGEVDISIYMQAEAQLSSERVKETEKERLKDRERERYRDGNI